MCKLDNGGIIILYFDINYFFNNDIYINNNKKEEETDLIGEICSQPFHPDPNVKINNSYNNFTDLRLISVAFRQKACIVTKDYSFQLLALQMGVPAEDYKKDKAKNNENYTGCNSLSIGTGKIDEIYDKKILILVMRI
jgi:predicted ribonuclease YlaK